MIKILLNFLYKAFVFMWTHKGTYRYFKSLRNEIWKCERHCREAESVGRITGLLKCSHVSKGTLLDRKNLEAFLCV